MHTLSLTPELNFTVGNDESEKIETLLLTHIYEVLAPGVKCEGLYYPYILFLYHLSLLKMPTSDILSSFLLTGVHCAAWLPF